MAVEKLIVDHIDTWTTALQTRSTAGRGSSGKIDLYGIKKLRELILELAVRGKLVPQDPNDEPASVLLERIAAEKAELVKQGKIKKPKPLPEISEEEKPFELPEGWEWTRLGAIAFPLAGFAFKSSHFNTHGEGLPLIRIRDVGQEFSETYYNGEYRSEFLVEKNDYLISMDGIFRIAAWQGPTALLNQRVSKLIFHSEEVSFEFISNSLQLHLYKLQGIKAYTTVDHLSANQITEAFIPLPPKNEQFHIQETYSKLMSLCDQVEGQTLTSLDAHQQLVETLLTTLTDSQNANELAENWARISEHFDTLFITEASIDALKQTILQLAVMGKLVPQDPNDEPASELLKCIAQEKAQLVKDGKIKKQKPLPPISDEEKPFELPIGWEWCRLGECINLISGQHLKPDEYEEECHGEMLPYITGPAEFGLISPTYSKYTNEKRAIAAKGDILITCKGAGLGKLNVADTNIAISRQLMAINVIRMNSEYLKIILDSMYGYFQSKGVGIAIPGISREDVMEPLIMLPPFEEQKRIMEKLYKLNFLIEDIKFRIKSAQQTQLHLADALTDAAIN
ncbi:restriction endonuclease subunit S [Salmonella enterica]|nr:restriction endonuclease subunit S [Salmonella enterica]